MWPAIILAFGNIFLTRKHKSEVKAKRFQIVCFDFNSCLLNALEKLSPEFTIIESNDTIIIDVSATIKHS